MGFAVGITFFLLMGGYVVREVCGQSCEDLDTTACTLLMKSKPDLCNEPTFADVACRRFCGRCPLTCYHCPTPTNSTTGCTTTKSCPAAQTCMLKTLNAQDGHHEYIATCEDGKLCSGLGNGFGGMVGRKRNSINIACCNADLCNSPVYTTTMSSSPPTTPIPVHVCQSDIIFVLDESGSIGLTGFKEIINFVRQVVTGLDIGPHGDLVGVLVYDSQPHLQWNLNEYTTKAELLNALTYVPYHDGTTHTELALHYVTTDMLTYAAGDRRNAKNVVIVVTDGQSTQKTQTAIESASLHKLSSNVIAIGVGPHIGASEVQHIATDTGHSIYIRNYGDLAGITSKVLNLIC